MKNLEDKLTELIKKAKEKHGEIFPCKGDWKKSYTIEKGEIYLWFNYKINGVKGMTTGLIKCSK